VLRFFAFAACLCLLTTSPAAAVVPLYVTPMCVGAGDSIAVHINYAGKLYVRLLDAVDNTLLWGDSVACTMQATPDSSFAYGCGWDTDLVLPAPSASGPYYIRVDPGTSFGVFWVHEDVPTTDVLVVYSDATSCLAYNLGVSGVSLYRGADGMYATRSYRVSLERPQYPNQGRGEVANAREINFLHWVRQQGVQAAYTTMSDLVRHPALYAQYPIWITWPHNEYMSNEDRQLFEDHLDGGGHWISMSGNECWWRVIWDPARTQIFCTKEPNSTTSLWEKPPANSPFNSTRGIGSGHPATGEYLESTSWTWTVWDSVHPITAGVGATFEMDHSHSFADEVDGLEINWSGGSPVPSTRDLAWGTPPGFHVIATLPAQSYTVHTAASCVIGTYTRPSGGTVVTFPMRNWGWDIALPSQTTLTLNAIAWLRAKTLDVPDGQLPARVRLWPNPARSILNVPLGEEALRIFDIQGRLHAVLPATDGRVDVSKLPSGFWITPQGTFLKVDR